MFLNKNSESQDNSSVIQGPESTTPSQNRVNYDHEPNSVETLSYQNLQAVMNPERYAHLLEIGAFVRHYCGTSLRC